MTRVSFYILNSTSSARRQEFACRLAEKAYLQGHQVYIHTASEAETQQLDEFLWTFRADSFVPHQCLTDNSDNDSPVLIGHQSTPPRLMDVLINLAEKQPIFFSQFERVAEIVDDNEHVKQAGRERYQFYRHRGYELKTHNI